MLAMDHKDPTDECFTSRAADGVGCCLDCLDCLEPAKGAQNAIRIIVQHLEKLGETVVPED